MSISMIFYTLAIATALVAGVVGAFAINAKELKHVTLFINLTVALAVLSVVLSAVGVVSSSAS